MFAYTLICALFACTAVRHVDGFLLDDKADCQMSQWAQWSAPHSYGMAYRERKILRYPTGGGTECDDDMVQVMDIEIPFGSSQQQFSALPLPVTANLMIDNFLRPSSSRVHKRGTNSVAMTRDLLLLVDASGSISQSEFTTSLRELNVLLGMLCPEQDPFDIKFNRAALMEFSSNANIVFDFDDNPNSAQLYHAISKTRFLGRDTCTGNAFNKAASLFQTARGARNDPNVKREVLIITDGRSNCGTNATVAARNLQTVADVYALTIGKPSAQGSAEIASYVTAPISSHLFATPNYQDLSKLVDLVAHQLKTHPHVFCMPFNT